MTKILYTFAALLSAYIRLFYLPNPFESMPYSMGILSNYIIEPVLHRITYEVVGIFYKKGSFPALGSILYLLFYSIHIGIVYVIFYFKLSIAKVMAVFIVYLFIIWITLTIKKTIGRIRQP